MEALVVSCLESRVEQNRHVYARFLIGPFCKGDALTVATALRRALLSSIEVVGITALYIQGITHEFSTIVGVRESVLEISLNFQQIVLSQDTSKRFLKQVEVGYLQVQGPRIVYANDLKLPAGIHLVDPTQYIATLSAKGLLVVKFLIGYNSQYNEKESSHAMLWFGLGNEASPHKSPIAEMGLRPNHRKAPSQSHKHAALLCGTRRFHKHLQPSLLTEKLNGENVLKTKKLSVSTRNKTRPYSLEKCKRVNNVTPVDCITNNHFEWGVGNGASWSCGLGNSSVAFASDVSYKRYKQSLYCLFACTKQKQKRWFGLGTSKSFCYKQSKAKQTQANHRKSPLQPNKTQPNHAKHCLYNMQPKRAILFHNREKRNSKMLHLRTVNKRTILLKSTNRLDSFSLPSDVCLRNVIPLDVVLTPVNQANFIVETDNMYNTVKERVIFEVWTNGSIHPRQAIHKAVLSLFDILSPFKNLFQLNTYLASSANQHIFQTNKESLRLPYKKRIRKITVPILQKQIEAKTRFGDQFLSVFTTSSF